jgi:hypothetical protein
MPTEAAAASTSARSPAENRGVSRSVRRTIAGWPPLALLLTVELVSRVPVHRPVLAVIRVLATTVISGIAAYVSYWHMAGVAARYGETDASPYLLPISVHGLIVVASISLVELAGRIRTAETGPTPVPVPVIVPNGPTVVPDRPAPAVPMHPVAVPIGPPPPQPVPISPELLAAARTAADEHHRTTGRDITRDALRDRLRVSNALAGELLRVLRRDGAPV